MAKLTDGAKVQLVVKHGAIERVLTGRLRKFSTEPRYDQITGEKTVSEEDRWELVDAHEDRGQHKDDRGQPGYEPAQMIQSYDAVGIDPKNVVSIDLLK
jgi:hypothetical protein